jgi:hypothetical protein|tara:strand:+ start:414 stop:788 length:375 start_codon:yes stop_codon:yes gene_type:complete
MSTKRNEKGLHPESLSLLRSIENDTIHRRKSNSDRALGKTTGGTTLVKLFGGFGVASLAIASYVSGYKSTSRELLSLGENKVKNKVVLHTGCSPVAQVRFRDVIAQRRGLSLSLRLKIFVSSYY